LPYLYGKSAKTVVIYKKAAFVWQVSENYCPVNIVMFIGILQIELFIGEAQSLKDKRRVVRSLVEKVRNRFNVAVAETGRLDSWNYCGLGFAFVSNEAGHLDSMMNSAVNFIESQGSCEVTDISTEIIPYE